MPYRKRAATAPGRRPGELRRLVPIAGLATAAVVVISSIDAGLPAGRTASAVVVVLTVFALALWCAALLRRIRGPRLLAAALMGTGLAGAALDVLRPSGPGFVLAYMAMAGLGLGLPRRPALTCGAVVVVAAATAEAATSEHPVSAALTLAAGAGALFLAATLAAVSRDAHAQAEALLARRRPPARPGRRPPCSASVSGWPANCTTCSRTPSPARRVSWGGAGCWAGGPAPARGL